MKIFITQAFLVTAWAASLPGAEEPASGLESGGQLETLETRGGKVYRGRVVGYDGATSSYLLLVDGRRLSLPEAEVLTIRGPGEGPEASRGVAAARGSLETALPAVTEAARPLSGEPAPRALPRLTEAGAAEAGAITLEGLARSYHSLPAPRTPEALQALEEAMEKLRSGDALSAVAPLLRAAQADPECPTPPLLLGAVHLEAERDPEAAYPHLLAAAARKGSTSTPASSLLASAAQALGYRRLSGQLAAEAIERRFEGAEREYHLFKLHERRDPQRARSAWREYRRLDPRWERVSTPEGEKLRQAGEALERGDATAATGLLLAAVTENPLTEEEGKPLLGRALLLRAERAQKSLRFEVALSDLKAMAEEFPQRESELAARQKEVEKACVEARLASAASTEEAEAAVSALAAVIPDVRTRFQTEVAGALLGIARNALPREGFEAAARALKAGRSSGRAADPAVLEGLAQAVSRDIAAGELTRARERLAQIAELAEGDGEVAGRLRDLKASLAAALRPVWKGELGRGDLAGAAATLRAQLELTPEDTEALRELAALAPPGAAPQDGPGAAAAGAAVRASLAHFPLVEGSRWVYLHGDGSREVQSLDRVEQLPDGRAVYRFTSAFHLAEARIPYQKTGFFAGEFFQIGAGSRAAGGELTLKVPVVKGDRWSWKKGDLAFEREYVATDARVVSRAGSFEGCLKVKATSRFDSNGTRSRPVVQWFYYAPGVGLVKIEAETAFDGRELTEYRIGPH